MALDQLASAGAAEVILETEVTNAAALRLYESRGFVREKRMHQFYLNGTLPADPGNDAFRLVLPMPSARPPSSPPPRRDDVSHHHIL